MGLLDWLLRRKVKAVISDRQQQRSKSFLDQYREMESDALQKELQAIEALPEHQRTEEIGYHGYVSLQACAEMIKQVLAERKERMHKTDQDQS